jgi:AcrR family transcriptional regulator
LLTVSKFDSLTNMNGVVTLTRTQESRTEEARARLCAAALQMFAMRGYEQVSLADISIHAGYSRALAGYHFGSKAALASHILTQIGERDMKLSLLPDKDVPGEEAWTLLLVHAEASWANLSRIHSDCEHGLSARGEMLLRAAAMYSPDPALRETFAAVGRRLTQRVAQTLALCRRDGVIRADVDAGAAATFYVMSIWGLLSALYVDPKAAKQIDASFGVLRQFLESLHVAGGKS